MTRKAFLLSAALLPASLVARSPTTALTVKVTGNDNKPIDRASVVIRFVEGHSMVKLGKAVKDQYELKTNQEGVARIPPIPRGKIQIQVIAPKYQTFGGVYELTEDQKTIDVHLNPPQTQYSSHE